MKNQYVLVLLGTGDKIMYFNGKTYFTTLLIYFWVTLKKMNFYYSI